ncbi:site-specific integrase [Telmatobacter bradus]|uniref:site-specific integrase n=1 Tax=Telmatobacter bradus TaxID=474953 RepID=UPI003B43B2E0
MNLSQTSSSTEPLTSLRPGDSLFETAQAASQYIRAARANSTRRAYESDWHDFLLWCNEHQIEPLPATASSIALYLTSLAQKGRKVATIARRLTSINIAHKRVGLAPPSRNQQLITETMQGIRRTLGVRQKVKLPIDLELLKRSLASAEGALAASRDRAVFLVGFAGGMRRSELAAMKFEDLTWHKRGITIFLPNSKTDQEGQGREVELPLGSQDDNVPLAERTCPVRALEQWLKIASISSGPVFRRISHAQTVGKTGLDPRSIAEIVKRLLRRTGLSEKEVARYGAHSLRAGFATEAYSRGASELAIMRQTGHKSSAMLRRYIRSDKADRMAAASKLGL